MSRTIQIIFDGVDNTAGAFNAVAGGISDVNDSINTATQPFADLTNQILMAEAAALALAAGFGVLAARTAGEFNDAFSEISTLITASDENLASFSDELLAYSATSTQSLANITAATYDAISSGVSYEDAIDALTVAEQLAVASKTDLNTAMNLLVPTLNAYGASMDEVGRYSDVFFTTVKEGKTTMPELGAVMGTITPTAAAMGVSVEEVGAALATMTANGMLTTDAATALKSTLSAILAPSQSASEAAAALGIEMGATALEAGGLDGWLKSVMAATNGNKDAMASLIGSSEALAGVFSLVSGDADVWGSKLQAMKDAAGSTAAAYDTMADSFTNTGQRVANSVTVMLVEAGQPLLDGWGRIADGLSKVFLSLGESFDEGAFDPIYDAFNDMADYLQDQLTDLAANLPDALAGIDWDGFIESMRGIGRAIGDLFGDLDLSTAEGLEQALQSIVDVATRFNTIVANIISGFGPLMQSLGDAALWFSELDLNAIATFGTFLAAATTINIVSGAFTGLITAASGIAGIFTAIKAAALLAAPALAGIAAPVAVLVAGAGALYLGYQYLNKEIEVNGETYKANHQVYDETAQKIHAQARVLVEQEKALQRVRDSSGLNVRTMEELAAALRDGVLVYDEARGELVKHGYALDENSIALRKMVDLEYEFEEAIEEEARNIRNSDIAMRDKAAATEHTANMQKGYTQSIIDGVTTLTQYGGALAGTKPKIDDTAQSIAEAKKKADEMALAWAELASSEREIMFQAAADIQVAKIEADAERVAASMEMLGSSFENTGELLSELFNLWADADRFDQSQIEDWIDREYTIREALAKVQLELTQAEIERIRAQTQMLERGGVELKISSDGLEPELEAFMFKVIDKIRVSVAGTYEEFLIGAGCGA